MSLEKAYFRWAIFSDHIPRYCEQSLWIPLLSHHRWRTWVTLPFFFTSYPGEYDSFYLTRLPWRSFWLPTQWPLPNFFPAKGILVLLFPLGDMSLGEVRPFPFPMAEYYITSVSQLLRPHYTCQVIAVGRICDTILINDIREENLLRSESFIHS